MAKKKSSKKRNAPITAPHPSVKKLKPDLLPRFAKVYLFKTDGRERVWWQSKDGKWMLQLADKSTPAFPQTEEEMLRLENFDRISFVREMPLQEWSQEFISEDSASNTFAHFKGTIFDTTS